MNTLLHVQSPYTQPRLKTMPLREQPAYRVTQDATACNQTELLAALIGGQKQIEIAQDLLAHFGNDIRRIYQAHPQELAKVKGINQATAVRIKAALHLGLRLSLPADERTGATRRLGRRPSTCGYLCADCNHRACRRRFGQDTRSHTSHRMANR